MRYSLRKEVLQIERFTSKMNPMFVDRFSRKFTVGFVVYDDWTRDVIVVAIKIMCCHPE